MQSPLSAPIHPVGVTMTRGFADPVTAAQATFRAVMMALAEPGTVHRLNDLPVPPPHFDRALAAVALSLLDHETPVWLDASLTETAEVARYLRFHTGAPIVDDLAAAAFAVIADPSRLPRLSDCALGTLDYPDRSATLLVAVEVLTHDGGFTLAGPGIAATARLAIEPLPADFMTQWAANGELFPRGIDLVFAHADRVAALPRTTKLTRSEG